MSDSMTLWTVAHQLICAWDFPGKNTGEDCHALLQGLFLTQGSKLALPPCRQVLYLLSEPPGSPTVFGLETCSSCVVDSPQ